MAYNCELRRSSGTDFSNRVNVATDWSLIDNKPTTFTPVVHQHDDRYYTEEELKYDQIYMRRTTLWANGIPSNNLGDPSLAEMALFQEEFSNKTAFYDPTYLKFYKSTNGTDFVEDTAYSTADKMRFLGGDAYSNIVIPNQIVKYRIELACMGGYESFNSLYMYWSSNSHSTKVHVWIRNSATSAWSQLTSSDVYISSWPGHLFLPFPGVWFLNPSDGGGAPHSDMIRFEFTPSWATSGDYQTYPINFYKMQIWGGYPADRRVIYETDYERNVTFPEKLSADTLFAATSVGIGATNPAHNFQVQQTSITDPAIMVGGAFSGGPRLQVYGLDADPHAWMGLGTDMGGDPYELSVYYPTYEGNGKVTFGTYDGTTYTPKLSMNKDGAITAAGLATAGFVKSSAAGLLSASGLSQAEIEAALVNEVASHWHSYSRHSAGNRLGLFGVGGDPQFYSDGAGLYYDLYHTGNLAAGAGANDFCAGDDARLSDSRSANDVYAWAKAATKPAYNQDEVSDGSTYFRVTQGEKTNLASAYNHSVAAHAPSNAQKNSDITLAEIEAKLVNEITSHWHSYARHSTGNRLGLFGTGGNPQYYADGVGLYYDLYHTGNKPAPFSSIRNFTPGTTSNGTTAVALATTRTFAAGDVIGLCLRSSSGADGADSIVWIKLGSTGSSYYGGGFFPATSAGTGMTYYQFEIYYSGSTLYIDDAYVCSITTGPTFSNTTTTSIYVYDCLLLA